MGCDRGADFAAEAATKTFATISSNRHEDAACARAQARIDHDAEALDIGMFVVFEIKMN